MSAYITSCFDLLFSLLKVPSILTWLPLFALVISFCFLLVKRLSQI